MAFRYLLSRQIRGEKADWIAPSVRLVSSSSPDLHSGPIDLEDILSAQCGTFAGHRSLIQVNEQDSFFIWTQEVFETSHWSLQDAVAHTHSLFQRGGPQSTTFLFAFVHQSNEKSSNKTHIVSILNLDCGGAKSVSIPYNDRYALDERQDQCRSKHPGFFVRNLPFIITAAILLAFTSALIATPMILRYQTDQADMWLKWDIPNGSKGCQNQLQYTYPHPNFTSWAAETHHENVEWFLRIDDQTLIPSDMLVNDDIRYNTWFERRYPQFQEVAQSKDYLNETFWLEPKTHPLPIDHQFHVTHCVLVLKRYWRARESNRHVCPRDLDHTHLKHCFTVLEALAIPDFEPEEPVGELVTGTDNIWIVNACF